MAQNNDMHRIARELSRIGSSSDEYSDDDAAKAAALTLIRMPIRIQTASVLANGSNAVAANANPTQFRAHANGRVLACHFIPTGAVVQHATNNANLKAVVSPANGAAGTVVASANTNTVANGGTGTLAAGAPVALTVTDIANARFTKGQVLSATVDQNSSGVAVDAGIFEYIVELEGPADDVGLT